jgi:glycosyltransferase involved in cell wall biosynthesis
LQPTFDLLQMATVLRRLRPSVYHSAEWGQPLPVSVPVVMTVHDLIPFRFPQFYPWVRRARVLPLRILRHSTEVIAVSRATAADLVRLAHVDPARVTVIPESASAEFTPGEEDATRAIRARFDLRGAFLLAVGTLDPRKRPRLLAAVAREVMKSHDVQLVIAGDQGVFAARVNAALEQAGIASRVRVTGYLSQPDLVALYRSAACLLLTSAYEGFGLPVLEAMACGTPVVMYDNSSLPEVAGPAGVLVREGDVGAMAGEALRLLHDAAEHERRSQLGLRWAANFSWRRTAEATVSVYRRAAGH